MPWKACKPMDERLKFIARLLDGEPMAVLCREFGISRKTGYKILTRYNEIGLEGLTDRSRRPYRHLLDSPLRLVECAGLSGSPLRGMTLEKHRHVLQASGLIHHANEF